MSTNSCIIIEENGEFTGIYCHYDGDLTHNGIILLKYYNTAEKVKELISLGDISSLGVTIENNCNSYEEWINLSVTQRPVNSYFRDFQRYPDRKSESTWNEVAPLTSHLIRDFLQEYIYIFDTKENKWYVFHEDWEKLRDLEEICNDRAFLTQFYSGIFLEDYVERNVEKTLNKRL